MKRYIRASLSPDIPDWLRRSLAHDFGKELSRKFNVALDRVKFLDYQPEGRSLPVYLIDNGYSGIVYAPGVNDSQEMQINGRWRKLGSVAKSKLPDMATDMAWIDLDDEGNTFKRRNKYEDPRYSYRYSPEGKYAGQFRRRNYNRETGEYEVGEWSERGMTPANESQARDKSGYKVPKPEEMITRFYSKYPEKVTQKIDEMYDRIKDVQSELMAADFKSPTRYSSKFRNAYSRFGDAVDEYRHLLESLGEDGTLSEAKMYRDPEYAYSHFANNIKAIKRDLNDTLKYLAESDR